MDSVPAHGSPVGKEQTLATWRKRMRMPVPTGKGHIIDLQIVTIYETSKVNGLPLDFLIDAQKTSNDPVKQFGVVFSDTPPDWEKYGVPVLWRQEGSQDVGRWK